MTRFSHLNSRNLLIALHDVLATAAAFLAACYLRFDGGELFYDRLPLMLRILPYFLALSVVVSYVCNLTTAKWRFISLPDALNIFRTSTVLSLALLLLDYVLIGPTARGTYFFGKVTIVLYWFLQVSFLSALRFAYRYFRYTRVRRHAKEEAGVSEPAAGGIREGLAVLPRIARLGLRKSEFSLGTAGVDALQALE